LVHIQKLNNCFFYDNEQIWCDYTDDHKDIREKSEKEINDFKQGNKAYPIVLQAPYGSGKTSLMRYLILYSWSNNIPAIKIDLSDLVDYIMKNLDNQNVGKINANRLPDYMEHFCNSIRQNLMDNERDAKKYLDSFYIKDFRQILEKQEKCILLIDEVEESLEELTNLLHFETNPFRALFDNVISNKSKILPILAYGPLTMAKSIEGTSGEWRTHSLSIPLVDVSYILDKIDKNNNILNQKYNKGISNFLWFLSRGRPGWIAKLLKEDLDKRIYELLSKNDYKEIRDFLINELISKYLPSNEFTKDTEIINIADIENDMKGNPMFSTHVLYIKPVHIKETRVTPTKNEILFYSTQIINIKYLIDYYSGLLNERLRGLDNNEIVKIVRTIEKFLNALSDENNNMLFSKEYLNETNNALLAFIQDVFYQNPDIENVFENVDIDYMYNLLKKYAVEEKTTADNSSGYLEVSPNKIIQYFPLESAIPLIGEARKHRNQIYNITLPIFDFAPYENETFATSKNLSIISNNVKEIFKDYFTSSELDDKFFILIPSNLINSNFLKKLNDFLYEPEFIENYTKNNQGNLLSKYFIFILINLGQTDPDKSSNIISEFESLSSIKALVKLNRAFILPVSGRSAVFLAGLLSNILKDSLDVDKLTVLEKRILNSFSKTISITIDNLLRNNKELKANYIFTELSRDLKAILDNLEGYKDLFFYLIKFQSRSSMDFLDKILSLYLKHYTKIVKYGMNFYKFVYTDNSQRIENKLSITIFKLLGDPIMMTKPNQSNDIYRVLSNIKGSESIDLIKCLSFSILSPSDDSESIDLNKCKGVFKETTNIKSIEDLLENNHSYVDIRDYIASYLKIFLRKHNIIDDQGILLNKNIHEIFQAANNEIDSILGQYLKNDMFSNIIRYNIIKKSLNQEISPSLIRDQFEQIENMLMKYYRELNDKISKLNEMYSKICNNMPMQLDSFEEIKLPLDNKPTSYDALIANVIQYELREKEEPYLKQPLKNLKADIDNLTNELQIIYNEINNFNNKNVKISIINEFLEYIKNDNKCVNVIKNNITEVKNLLVDINNILDTASFDQDKNEINNYINRLQSIAGKGENQ
jgi:hypothetical protein